MTLKLGRSYNYRMIASECYTYYKQYNTDLNYMYVRTCAGVLVKQFFLIPYFFPHYLYFVVRHDLVF